ncbi:MbeD family mobilization/exclusion protein [Salmonella enterica subsp. enterica serovar Rissen]|nr:MbeD family mobilization/exclusion protein [Salmonella enterica subsp. enterica serovar Agona]MBJ2644809.1 MbeD family mobilization/exclusion protein [Salmonella enterica subsp. enterica serovar Typhimurium]MBJ4096937.1 MbeD family mobilization/exclusion protein [Salmonella enterica subsp. enterica serovar Rissen]MBJ5928159.1 MbeD family mobilization/exclusion protein [Salmonella enterica subsp. enterica serovar Rissen]
MTELEKQLLTALEQLHQDYSQRLDEWESAFAELQKMHEVTQRNNAILNERVVILSQQVQRLAGQVDRLSRLFIANNS